MNFMFSWNTISRDGILSKYSFVEDGAVGEPNVQDKLLAATTTISKSNGSSEIPRLIYEPSGQSCYGSVDIPNGVACSIQEDPVIPERKILDEEEAGTEDTA